MTSLRCLAQQSAPGLPKLPSPGGTVDDMTACCEGIGIHGIHGDSTPSSTRPAMAHDPAPTALRRLAPSRAQTTSSTPLPPWVLWL